jgi:hypothetical protein
MSNFAVLKYKGSSIYTARKGRFQTSNPFEQIKEPNHTNPTYPTKNLTYKVNTK